MESTGSADLRLLVLDESRVLPWVIEHLVPEWVTVEHTDSLAAALDRVRVHDADAAMVSLTFGKIPWQDFQELCDAAEPPVPVLYESCVHTSVAETGVRARSKGYADFVAKPVHAEELRAKITRLLDQARRLAVR